MAIEGSVKLPVFGEVKKKTAAVVAGVSVVGVLAVWYIRQRKASQSASAAAAGSSSTTTAAAGTVTDPAGNVCSSDDIDPETGFCSGSEEDESALEEASGDLDDEDLTGLSDDTSPVATTTTFATNAAWAQAAEQYLGSDGADTTAAAISKYIAGQQMTTAQETTVEEAIAAEGYPPVAGANGYPPALDVTGTTSGGGGSSSGGSGSTGTNTDVTVPSVLGLRAVADAEPKLKAAGLVPKIKSASFNSKTENYVVSQTPAPGKQVASGSTVSLNTSTKKP